MKDEVNWLAFWIFVVVSVLIIVIAVECTGGSIFGRGRIHIEGW